PGHVLTGLAEGELFFFFSSRRRHTRFSRDWSSDVCSSDLDPKDQEFKTKKGPIFANIILADEINRSPAKVQLALLEAMQEHTVTDRKSVVQGKSVAHGGRRRAPKKEHRTIHETKDACATSK